MHVRTGHRSIADVAARSAAPSALCAFTRKCEELLRTRAAEFVLSSIFQLFDRAHSNTHRSSNMFSRKRRIYLRTLGGARCSNRVWRTRAFRTCRRLGLSATSNTFARHFRSRSASRIPHRGSLRAQLIFSRGQACKSANAVAMRFFSPSKAVALSMTVRSSRRNQHWFRF